MRNKKINIIKTHKKYLNFSKNIRILVPKKIFSGFFLYISQLEKNNIFKIYKL